MKPRHPSELIREAVADATAFGLRQGFGKVVGDCLYGDTVVLTFEGGQQVSVPMPKSASLGGPERVTYR